MWPALGDLDREAEGVWQPSWGMIRDPFLEGAGPYVPLPGSEEAVARLVHAIEAGHRCAVLCAAEGMGKTLVLTRAIDRARSPARRFALASSPMDPAALYGRLAHGLGARQRLHERASESEAWYALERAVRVCLASGFQVILAVDEVGMHRFQGESEALRRLMHLGTRERGRVTVVLAVDCSGRDEAFWPSDWALAIGLAPISCAEAETYLAAKLAAAGCTRLVFSPSAVARLHLHSGGSPRGLDRLASPCLKAAATRGLETVSAELVESAIAECRLPTGAGGVVW
jgi:type II secretory pathway predicted ATPase ExeA